MRKILPVVVVFGAVWLWQRLHGNPPDPGAGPPVPTTPMESADGAQAGSFRCDGRTYCSQMTSCAEATYFLQHCPDVKMDGNHDGVPCERQWCGSR
jgi:hypothetical protein